MSAVFVHPNVRVPGSQLNLVFAKGVCSSRLLKRTVGTDMNRVSFGPHSFSNLDFTDDVALLSKLLELLGPALERMSSEATCLRLELNWARYLF